MSRLRWLAFLAFLIGDFAGAATVRGDEPSGLAAAAAIEAALEGAIAKAEKSVVAIARVSQESAPVELRGDVFSPQRFLMRPAPDEPDFIPNDFATGVVVDPAGLILTAHHVLKEGSAYYVTTSERRTYPAKVVASDPRGDLAVLRIDAKNLPAIALGDASKLRKGQIVVALGNPYAIARDGQASASWGIVSNLARKDGPSSRTNAQSKPTLHQNGTLIQTDAKLNLGTSGGALINLSGEMVGLTISLAAFMGYEQPAGFAIPVDESFKRALARLKEGREAEYGFLGVSITNVSVAEPGWGRFGVAVDNVVRGTPAAAAGLAKGDLINKVGDKQVRDVDEFMLTIGSLPAGEKVRLTIFRDGRTLTREVELWKYSVIGSKVVTVLDPAWRGLRVDYLTGVPSFRERSQRDSLDEFGTVVITDVEQDSPAWREGLRPEMTISHVAGLPISTPRDFADATAGRKGPIQLTAYQANGIRLDATIKPEATD